MCLDVQLLTSILLRSKLRMGTQFRLDNTSKFYMGEWIWERYMLSVMALIYIGN